MPLTRADVPYVKLSDAKASGTNGGSSLATTWNIRDLNTEDIDTHGICSLATNQFTLPPGTYRINASAPTYKANASAIKLYNITDAADEFIGENGYAAAANAIHSLVLLKGEFTITATKTFELRHYTNAANATTGLGVGMVLGNPEIYTVIELWKVG